MSAKKVGEINKDFMKKEALELWLEDGQNLKWWTDETERITKTGSRVKWKASSHKMSKDVKKYMVKEVNKVIRYQIVTCSEENKAV